jgi:HD-GYP domain-containing protein (c-di-GMP phosphodiesterase class II)
VQKSYFDTIKALVQAVEEKDPYTRGHSERVRHCPIIT